MCTLEIAGLKQSLSYDLPASVVSELPKPDQRMDVVLDLGSTLSKVGVRVGGREFEPTIKPTTTIATTYSLPTFTKHEVVSSPESLGTWLASALPALATYAAERGAFLGSVCLGMPLSEKDLARARLEAESVRSRVAVGTLHLVPEHALLARHYLRAVQALANASDTYTAKYAENESRRARLARLLRERQQAVKEYEQRSWFGQWFHPDPRSMPAPEQIDAMQAPQVWMSMLVDSPDRLDRVLLMDAGGFSIDVALLAMGEQIEDDVCRSHTGVGGEDLSKVLVPAKSSQAATLYKAQLGQSYTSAGREALDGDEALQSYLEQTNLLYGPTVRAALSACRHHFGDLPFLVLLCGGASLNPFLKELVEADAGNLGLDVLAVEPNDLLEWVDVLAELEPALSDPAVEHIQRVRGWHHQAPRHLSYDPYALLGGMMVLLDEE